MKIVVACDSFKGSLSSRAVGDACARGISSRCEVTVVPVADGGEGTVEAMAGAMSGRIVSCTVHGPLGEPAEAHYAVSGDGKTAVMEMAEASGLTLIAPEHRNPLDTTTYGTGEMIRDALDRGCRTIVMGIGGSATNDGGMGMLAALGATFYDDDARDLEPKGMSLGRVERIDFSELDKRLAQTRFLVACDVDNPLYGPRGAAYVFAPQKGASPEIVELLDQGLKVYAGALAEAVGRDVSGMPGAGAAGGLGAAFAAVLNAELKPGIDLVLDLIRFDELIAGADLVITGEGRIDAQTLMGKTPQGVLQRARAQGIPVVAIGGAVSDAQRMTDAGFAAVLPVVSGPCTLKEAMEPAVADANVARTAAQIYNLIMLKK